MKKNASINLRGQTYSSYITIVHLRVIYENDQIKKIEGQRLNSVKFQSSCIDLELLIQSALHTGLYKYANFITINGAYYEYSYNTVAVSQTHVLSYSELTRKYLNIQTKLSLKLNTQRARISKVQNIWHQVHNPISFGHLISITFWTEVVGFCCCCCFRLGHVLTQWTFLVWWLLCGRNWTRWWGYSV